MTAPINNELPYVEETVVVVNRLYNPKYGDDRVCRCAHSYYRHFDTWEGMANVGCKYCECGCFEEAPTDPDENPIVRCDGWDATIGQRCSMTIKHPDRYCVWCNDKHQKATAFLQGNNPL